MSSFLGRDTTIAQFLIMNSVDGIAVRCDFTHIRLKSCSARAKRPKSANWGRERSRRSEASFDTATVPSHQICSAVPANPPFLHIYVRSYRLGNVVS